MRNALANDRMLGERSLIPVRAPSAALIRVVPDEQMATATGASIWRRLERMHMSEVDRRAAVDALLLGRDIGKALQYVGRAMRRWLGRETATRHSRQTSFRRLVRSRRARIRAERRM